MDFLPELGMIAANRRDDDEAIPPKLRPGLQGQGGVCRCQGRKDADGTGPAIDVHPNQLRQWKDQLLEGASGVFGEPKAEALRPLIDVKTLHAKIGALTLENDFLESALAKAGLPSAKR